MKLPLDGSPFVVGIDLGTTNSALAQGPGDPEDESGRVEVRPVTQLVNPGEVADAALLPSFAYLPSRPDFPAGTPRCPGTRRLRPVVGELARRRGAEVPARVVASAKSWLSYAGVEPAAPILPWQAPEDVPSCLPCDASARSWRTCACLGPHGAHPAIPLAEQDVVLTVPASFDEVARELTVQAAAAGGPRGGARCSRSRRPRSTRGSIATGDRWRERRRASATSCSCATSAAAPPTSA